MSKPEPMKADETRRYYNDEEWVNFLKIEAPEELQDYSYMGIDTYRMLWTDGTYTAATFLPENNDFDKLYAEPRVLNDSIERGFRVSVGPGDGYITSDAHINSAYSHPGVYLEDRLVELHELDRMYGAGFNGEGMVVGIMDTGLTKETRDVLGDRVLDYRDFVGDVSGGYAMNERHGDWCSLAALLPKAKLVHAKCLNDEGSGSFAQVTEAMGFLAQHPEVDAVGCSIGGGTRLVTAWEQIIKTARTQRDRPFFVSAGNSGCPVSGSNVECPGNSPSALALAACDPETLDPASFSCCGDGLYMTLGGYRVFVNTIERAFSGTSMTPGTACQIYMAVKQASGQGVEAILTAMSRSAYDQPDVAVRNEGAGLGKAYEAYRALVPEAPVETLDPWADYPRRHYMSAPRIKEPSVLQDTRKRSLGTFYPHAQ